jgi:hypothetical protein
VFGRSRTTNEELAEQATTAARVGAKNRPTPKRRDQEAARKQPLVVTDRKAARNTDRAKRREAMAKQRRAMLTGDEAHLPPRDKGLFKPRTKAFPACQAQCRTGQRKQTFGKGRAQPLEFGWQSRRIEPAQDGRVRLPLGQR